jgi:hypothetical protein
MITESDLKGFSGTENYYKDYLNLNITDGVKFLMEKCCCGWLISDIASVNFCERNIKDKPFLIVSLLTNPTLKTATLIMKEDTNEPILYRQQYDYTDINDYYADTEIKFYLINGVLLLPSEY